MPLGSGLIRGAWPVDVPAPGRGVPAGLRTRVRPDGTPSRSPSGVVPRPSPSPLRVSSGFAPDSLTTDVVRLARGGYQGNRRVNSCAQSSGYGTTVLVFWHEAQPPRTPRARGRARSPPQGCETGLRRGPFGAVIPTASQRSAAISDRSCEACPYGPAARHVRLGNTAHHTRRPAQRGPGACASAAHPSEVTPLRRRAGTAAAGRQAPRAPGPSSGCLRPCAPRRGSRPRRGRGRPAPPR